MNRNRIHTVYIRCSHSQGYDNTLKEKKKHRSCMSNCPFRAKLKPRASLDGIRGWHLSVTCPHYNHPAAFIPLALPHFRKIGENSKRIVKIGSQIGRPGAEMLKELLEISEVTTLQDISNVKRKFSTAELGRLAKI
jgi:hypothetical protein